MISTSCGSSKLQRLEELMPWTENTRPEYGQRDQRYSSNTTDKEWALIELFMPPKSKFGRPRETDMRTAWNAIQYIAATGMSDLGSIHQEISRGACVFRGRQSLHWTLSRSKERQSSPPQIPSQQRIKGGRIARSPWAYLAQSYRPHLL